MTPKKEIFFDIKANAPCCEVIRSYLSFRPFFDSAVFRYHVVEGGSEDIKIISQREEKCFKTPVRMGDILDFMNWSIHKGAQHIIHFGEKTLDVNSGVFSNHNRDVRLTEKEVAVLVCLHENKGAGISRKDLLSTVWEYADGVETHTLETHIYRLRQKIENDPSNPEVILTNDDGTYRLA